MALPKGYYRASPNAAAGIEFVVFSDGYNYYSYQHCEPTEPLDESELVIDTNPLYLCE